MPDATGVRPAVSVVLPFFGDADQARRMLAALDHLGTAPGDEIIAVDNTDDEALVGAAAADRVTAISSSVKRSAYAARNIGAEHASNEWLLFLDADCRPGPDLLEEYFREPIDPECGAIAGAVVGNPDQTSLAARYARERGFLGIEANRNHPHLPAAVTANLLVRRQAWSQLGGFHEGMRAAAGDTDFAWRLQERGWKLGYRTTSRVEHDHRDTTRSLLRQVVRNSAGAAWANRRHPDSLPRPRMLRGLTRSIAGLALFPLLGQFRRAEFKAVDAMVIVAQNIGRLADNAPAHPLERVEPPGSVIMLDSFPERPDGGLVARLARSERRVRVEARSRARDPDWSAVRQLRADLWEDAGPARRTTDCGWLVLRHPLRVLRDLGDRRATGIDVTPLREIAPAARRLSRGGEAEIAAIPGTRAALDSRRLAGLIGCNPQVLGDPEPD